MASVVLVTGDNYFELGSFLFEKYLNIKGLSWEIKVDSYGAVSYFVNGKEIIEDDIPRHDPILVEIVEKNLDKLPWLEVYYGINEPYMIQSCGIEGEYLIKLSDIELINPNEEDE
jgi:hypothetical protein